MQSKPPAIPVPPRSYVLAIHAGAGAHSRANDRTLRRSLRACLAHVEQKLLWDAPAADVVVTAVAFLEDLPFTNAGTGCTLTSTGDAECDAVVVTPGAAGAVGTLKGVRNPIRVADALRSAHECPPDPLGLHPPSVLVGEGAQTFAESIEIPVNVDLRTARTKALYKEYSARAANVANVVLDTVGAAAIDVNGNVAAAASSGGGWLRPPGRVGAAGVPGAAAAVDVRAAALASGHGERIVAESLAMRAVVDPAGASWRAKVAEAPVGVLVLARDGVNGAVVEFQHSTAAFAVAWAAPAQKRQAALVSRGNGGSTVEGGARLFRG